MACVHCFAATSATSPTAMSQTYQQTKSRPTKSCPSRAPPPAFRAKADVCPGAWPRLDARDTRVNRVQALVQAALPGLSPYQVFPESALAFLPGQKVPPAKHAAAAAASPAASLTAAAAAAAAAAPRAARASDEAVVAVVAPGAGTKSNGRAYSCLNQSPDFQVEVLGQSGAPYDCYPECFRQGRRGQNLKTFAEELLRRGLDRKDCLIVGSRGGQVVLPHLWRCRGGAVPPAVVINGGCAAKLPTPTLWPEAAVTFLLIGGQDHFNQGLPEQEYLAQTKSHVPPGNRTTAILYVSEMGHMPHPELLESVLRPMLKAALAWKRSGAAAVQDLAPVRSALQWGSWSGKLLLTAGSGVWHEEPFGAHTALGGGHQVATARRR